jgi:hypothetical protein
VRSTLVAALLVVAACSSDDTAGADLSVDAAEDLSPPGGIGASCVADSQCSDGKAPVCFVAHLLNRVGFFDTPNGYCSSSCSADADCGTSGVCVSVGIYGKWCFAQCSTGSDCRSGYACFVSGGGDCYPNTTLTCDPTAPGGSCTTPAGQPGGCVREAFGSGLTGECYDTCEPGPGSCKNALGLGRQCEVYDITTYRDPSSSTNDAFHGAVCIFSYSSNAVGAECKTLSNGMSVDRVDACEDGLECWLAGTFPGGDSKCHVMCAPEPDGGVPDGGGAPGCPPGQICGDVFGLFSSANPIGLCH